MASVAAVRRVAFPQESVVGVRIPLAMKAEMSARHYQRLHGPSGILGQHHAAVPSNSPHSRKIDASRGFIDEELPSGPAMLLPGSAYNIIKTLLGHGGRGPSP